MTTPLIRVLAVDDSAVARTMYRALLTEEHGFDFIGTAPDAEIARKKIPAMNPDVVVLDIEMPGENGLSFLQWLMATHPTPVVISSSFSPRGAEQTLRAFALGAVCVVCKTATAAADGNDFPTSLLEAVRTAALAGRSVRRGTAASSVARPVTKAAAPAPVSVPSSAGTHIRRRGHIVVIGASTGGTEALGVVVSQMPADFPPTIVVQHMPALYTGPFSARLNTISAMKVSEATDGQTVGVGQLIVAPGGKQLRIVSGAMGPIACITTEPPVNRHAPSVDVMFDSAVAQYRSRVIGILLTGMGNDGAQGLLRIRQAGGWTIAQDEATSVVWGMPGEAVKIDGANLVLPIDRIIPRVLQWLSEAG